MCVGGATRKYDRQLRKGIWSMEVPNKYKNLIWRACRNSLSTKGSLAQRTTITDPICDRCAADEEDPLQALWSCSGLNGVWGDGELWGYPENFREFKGLVRWILKNCKAPELFFIEVWSIWNQRNQISHNQMSYPTDQLAQIANDRWEEYKSVRPMPNPRRQKQKTRWISPPTDVYKINFNVAVFPEGWS